MKIKKPTTTKNKNGQIKKPTTTKNKNGQPLEQNTGRLKNQQQQKIKIRTQVGTRRKSNTLR
jgi:hypothetical protein